MKDIKRNLIIVEQYLSWKGHYKQYFENLLSKSYEYIYCSSQDNNYPNGTFIKAHEKDSQGLGFISFIKGRFLNSLKAYHLLLSKQPTAAHLIEFEPFSYLLISIFFSKKFPPLIVTIHSINRMYFTNRFKNYISEIQRYFYRIALKKLAQNNACFVTHYHNHKKELLRVIGSEYENSVTVINYPCPQVLSEIRHKSLIDIPKLLIYGQIREDKGIFEFLSKIKSNELTITVAGRILDKRILTLNKSNIQIIDKYIEEEELKGLLGAHHFMLLPYPLTYSGGAGTLKDSLSFGLPVIASRIPIFQEIIDQEHLGSIFDEMEEIILFSKHINQATYDELVDNTLNYAKKYNWSYMRSEYFKLYKHILA